MSLVIASKTYVDAADALKADKPGSPITFTQTYSTTATTVSTATATAVATDAAALTAYGYTQAQADAIPVAINALVADVLVLRKLLNSAIDALQAAGISA